VPNHLHTLVGIAALNAGKNVLMEKPLANSLEDCDRLIAAATSSGAVLNVGHQLRVSAQWSTVKTILDRGEMGAPRYANFSLFRFPFRHGADGCRFEPGRVLVTGRTGTFFDLLVWSFEEWGEPISVRAIANGRAEHSALHENLTVWLHFGDGAYATVTQSLGGFENHTMLEVVGDSGSLRTWWSGVTDRTYDPRFELKVKHGGDDVVRQVPLSTLGKVFELEEQLRRTAEAFKKRRALVSGEQARKAVVTCLAAERSLRDGTEVALNK
jgi:myo-inositol 2-dehydrogenase / D-chiro-inositol 1-dehydrogenase